MIFEIKSSKFLRIVSAVILSFGLLLNISVAQEEPLPVPSTENAAEPPVSSPVVKGMNGVEVVSEAEDDLFLSSSNVDIKEGSNESIFIFTGNLNSTGKIGDSAYVIAKSAKFNGSISGDLFFAGEDLQLNDSIGNDLYAVGNRILIKGDVKNDLRVSANEVYIDVDDKLRGDVIIDAKKVVFSPNTKFKGNVTVNGILLDEESIKNYQNSEIPVDLALESNASSGGNQLTSILSVYGLVSLFASILGSAIFAWVMFKYSPLHSRSVSENLEIEKSEFIKNLKVSAAGFGVLLLSAIVISVVFSIGMSASNSIIRIIFTFIGVSITPVAMLGLVLVIIAFMVAKIFAYYKIGNYIVERVQPSAKGVFVDTVVGTLVVTLVFILLSLIPVVGNFLFVLASITMMFWSIGALLRVKIDDYKKHKA